MVLGYMKIIDPSKADSLKNEMKAPVDHITGKVESWWDTFLDMLPNMIVSALLFLIFLLIAKAAQRLFYRVFRKSTSGNLALQNLFGTFVYYGVICAGLFIILEVLQLEKAVTSLLAGVGVIGLALGFAFQDIAANFVSGIILAFRTPFRVGDVVGIDTYMGTVTRTNLRVSVISTFQGQEVYLPNKDVLQNPIINYTVLRERRVDLNVGVSYAEDLEKVRMIVLEAVGTLEGVIRHDDMIFHYYEFGDSSINFYIKFWVRFPDQPGFLEMQSRAIIAIKKAFDAAGITIPFPIRTLDFGIKGGEKLTEMLNNGARTS